MNTDEILTERMGGGQKEILPLVTVIHSLARVMHYLSQK